MIYQVRKDNFLISTDPKKLDLKKIHSYLTRTYWSNGIPYKTIERAFKHSLCFGVYDQNELIGVARVISDFATYAYLCDVFIEEDYRGKALGKWLVNCIIEHPDLQGLRRWSLLTKDAHGLYKHVGFQEIKSPEKYMEIVVPNIYQKKD